MVHVHNPAKGLNPFGT